MEDQIIFGDRMIPLKLPDNTLSMPPGLLSSLSPVDDIAGTIAAGYLAPDLTIEATIHKGRGFEVHRPRTGIVDASTRAFFYMRRGEQRSN
jgi:hypothetical protein